MFFSLYHLYDNALLLCRFGIKIRKATLVEAEAEALETCNLAFWLLNLKLEYLDIRKLKTLVIYEAPIIYDLHHPDSSRRATELGRQPPPSMFQLISDVVEREISVAMSDYYLSVL